MAELFVMVRDDLRVWRLADQTDTLLIVELPGARREVPKDLCRVGTARDWRGSWGFSAAWEAGGGEELVEEMS